MLWYIGACVRRHGLISFEDLTAESPKERSLAQRFLDYRQMLTLICRPKYRPTSTL
jgi:hypothetical protein